MVTEKNGFELMEDIKYLPINLKKKIALEKNLFYLK